MFARLRHRWLPAGVPVMLVAWLAIVSQLAIGAVVLPDEAIAHEQSAAALDAVSVLCDSSAPDQAPKHHRHDPDGAVCPLGIALAMPAVVLVSGPQVPAVSSRLVARASLPPPSRGPPAQPRPTPPSRGPPVLS